MNTINKNELIDKISVKLNKERIVVGGNKHAYKRRYHLKYTETIIKKVVDAFWSAVADTIADGEKILIQNYIAIYPKYTTNGNVNSYCVKTKAKEKLKEACRILNAEKKIPDDLQPDPPSDIFHETFAFSDTEEDKKKIKRKTEKKDKVD